MNIEAYISIGALWRYKTLRLFDQNYLFNLLQTLQIKPGVLIKLL